MSRFVVASFASVSSCSFLLIPTWALTQLNWIFQFVFHISVYILHISSMRNMWMLLFLSESSVIRLSVYMVALLFTLCMFTVRMFTLYSSALTIASCSSWLLVHLSFNLYFKIFCVYLIWIWLRLPLSPVLTFCRQ